MNDSNMGRLEGLMIALLLCEKNKKHPQRIQPELVKMLQKVGVDVASTAIDVIGFNATWAKTH